MKYVGTSKDQALKILDDVIKRSLPGSLGRIGKFELRNPLEHRTMTFALSHMKGGSLFTEDDLLEDFCRALVAKNVLSPREKVELRKIRAALAIVAMTIMHKCKIDLGDGTFAEIAIEQDKKGDLGCSAIAELGKKQGAALIAHFWVFESNLSVSRYCAPGIAPLVRSPFLGDFELSRSPDDRFQLALKL